MKKVTKKLTLSKETLRGLDTKELKAVKSGQATLLGCEGTLYTCRCSGFCAYS